MSFDHPAIHGVIGFSVYKTEVLEREDPADRAFMCLDLFFRQHNGKTGQMSMFTDDLKFGRRFFQVLKEFEEDFK